MSELVRSLEHEHVLNRPKAVPLADLRPGTTVKVNFRIVEGRRERVQPFQGVIIRVRQGLAPANITVRRIGAHGIGVERTFPLHSPRLESVEVLRRGHVRRANLYFLRDRTGKATRLREKRRVRSAVDCAGECCRRRDDMTLTVAADGDRIRSDDLGRGAVRASPLRLPDRAMPTLAWEERAWSAGAGTVAGVDEVGRGAWAGPVLAAAVVLRAGTDATDLAAVVRDSKQLSAAERCSIYLVIWQLAHAVSVGQASAFEVDGLGIGRANSLAMCRALRGLAAAPDMVLVDGYPARGWRRSQEAIVRGDRHVAAIAAASIVAKVTRDAAMIRLDATYPGYGFDAHKGYGTAEHRRAVRELGPTAEHRLTWAPFRSSTT